MFFLKKGTSRIDCTFEKDSIYTNERAVINCLVDNSHCDKNIREITLKLKRKIECTATSDSGKFEDESYLMTNTYPGVGHGEKRDLRLELDVNAMTDICRRIKKQHKKSKKEVKPEDIALQSQIVPTTLTSLISVKYFLEVNIRHRGLFRSKIPPTIFEIKVHSAPNVQALPPTPQIQIPQNWNPVVCQGVMLQIEK